MNKHPPGDQCEKSVGSMQTFMLLRKQDTFLKEKYNNDAFSLGMLCNWEPVKWFIMYKIISFYLE